MFFFLMAGVVTFSLFKCYTGIMTRRVFIWNLFLPAFLFACFFTACGSNTMEVISREYIQQGVTVNLEYPVFSASKELNTAVEKDISWYLDTCINECSGNNFDEGVLYVTYVPDYFTKDEVSFALEFYRYVGGANGITAVKTYNYSFKDGNWLSLSDVSAKSTGEISQELSAALSAKYNPENDAALESWILEGTSPEKGNFENFTFNDKSITFHYPKYEVLPGSYGVVSGEIAR